MAQLIATTVNGTLTVNGNLTMSTNTIESVGNITSTGTIKTSGDISTNKLNGYYITSANGANRSNSYFYYDSTNNTLYINIPAGQS